jgi:DNA-binding MarR family transcriptional regulator
MQLYGFSRRVFYESMDEFLEDKGLLVGVVSGKASTAINRKLYRAFRANGLLVTPEQWVLLQFLSVKDGISQQELANMAFKDKPSVTRLLDNLEKQALIARLADKEDKRSNVIYLTKDGIRTHEKARNIVVSAMSDALKGLSESEIHQALSILKKIYKNLS